jgi:putative tricarboxylic transport membrane protein
MKTLDRTSSLFWLLVSLTVLIESLRLGIGTVQNPGMGFMTFGASGILGFLALFLFLQASFRRETAPAAAFAGKFWKRVFFVIIILVLYARVMPVLGYLISTFVMMTIFFWVLERKRVWMGFVFSVLSTLITYIVFSKWLHCQFPDGLFGL